MFVMLFTPSILFRSEKEQAKRFKILIFTSTDDTLFPTRGEAVLRTWMDYANNKHPELNIHVVMALDEGSQYEERAKKEFPYMLVPKTSYGDLYIKIFHALASVYELYPDYDYYMKADDDLFINIDRLAKQFQESAHLMNPQENEWFGFNYNYMCWGGPGYLASRKGLEDIYPYLRTTCVDNYKQPEDVALANCNKDMYKDASNNTKEWVGCKRIPGTDGNQFAPLGEDAELWRNWDKDTHKTFHIDWQLPDQKDYSWDKFITVHPIKQEQNPVPNMDQLYAYSDMAGAFHRRLYRFYRLLKW
ncbi:hypothetical protein BGZ52_000903 [Haplosporangium bisporale]|nr:hypothetical protein BGZ52_000903 [Haplosporangium bisporale]